MPVRVALVEDNERIRHRFLARLRFFDDVTFVFAAESGEACLRKMALLPPEERPEVVLMDIGLPQMSGIETTVRLKEEHPGLGVIMLTVFDHDEHIFASIRAGAAGYLLKDASAGMIVGAVLDLVRGGAPMSPQVARRLLQRVRDEQDAESGTASGTSSGMGPASVDFGLSGREVELLAYLMHDLTEPQIAERLNISRHTVRAHIKSIYKKLRVHSRAAAVRVALRHRLLR